MVVNTTGMFRIAAAFAAQYAAFRITVLSPDTCKHRTLIVYEHQRAVLVKEQFQFSIFWISHFSYLENDLLPIRKYVSINLLSRG